MHSLSGVGRALSALVVLAASSASSEDQAVGIYKKHQVWFEHAAQTIKRSHALTSIPLAGNFFDEETKRNLNDEDRHIYVEIQTMMRQVGIRRVQIVGSGHGVKKMIAFIMNNDLADKKVFEVMAVSDGYSIDQFLSPRHRCSKLNDAGWYLCSVE